MLYFKGGEFDETEGPPSRWARGGGEAHQFAASAFIPVGADLGPNGKVIQIPKGQIHPVRGGVWQWKSTADLVRNYQSAAIVDWGTSEELMLWGVRWESETLDPNDRNSPATPAREAGVRDLQCPGSLLELSRLSLRRGLHRHRDPIRLRHQTQDVQRVA